MAETGCLRDMAVQNLEVASSGVQLTQYTGYTKDQADGAAVTTTLTNSDHGSIVKTAFNCNNGETAIINLPATVVNGFKCRIVLTADPAGTGTLTIRTNVAGNRLLSGGVIVASATAATSACANAVPASNDSSVSLTFTGAATNCDFAAGSVIEVEGIATATTSPGYLLTGYVLGFGTGTGGSIGFA